MVVSKSFGVFRHCNCYFKTCHQISSFRTCLIEHLGIIVLSYGIWRSSLDSSFSSGLFDIVCFSVDTLLCERHCISLIVCKEKMKGIIRAKRSLGITIFASGMVLYLLFATAHPLLHNHSIDNNHHHNCPACNFLAAASFSSVPEAVIALPVYFQITCCFFSPINPLTNGHFIKVTSSVALPGSFYLNGQKIGCFYSKRYWYQFTVQSSRLVALRSYF